MSSDNKSTKKTIEEDSDKITSVVKKEEETENVVNKQADNDNNDEITPVNDDKKVLNDNHDDDEITSIDATDNINNNSHNNSNDDDDLIITPVNEIRQEEKEIQRVKVPVTEPMTEPSIINSAKDEFVNFTSKMNPFAKKIGKGFYQVRQYATEKLGTAEEVTQLPEEYKDLEKRVDALRDIHNNLLKVTKTYGVQSYDYHGGGESILGITNSVTNQILSSNNDNRAPKTLSHALSRVASESANEMDGAYGMALSKYAVASDKLGNARLVMDHEIVTNFNERIQHTLKTSIQGVQKARKEVQVKRLALDAAKSKLKENDENGRLDVEMAEDQFVGVVEQATHLMKSLLQDPEPLRDLSAMAQAQLAYFKEAEDLFSGLVPELKDALMTQETLYRDSSNELNEKD